MTIFANYFKNFKINIYDKFASTLDKWIKAGRELISSASQGNETIWDNKDTEELIALPIVEKNFQNYFLNVFEKNLFFKNSLTNIEIADNELIFICVNTPSITDEGLKENFDLNFISQRINQGIQLSLDNVYSSIENILTAIINTNDITKVFRKRIIIQKSTVQIDTLKNIREKIIEFFKKNFSLVKNLQILSDNELINKAKYYTSTSIGGASAFLNIATDDEIQKFVDEYFMLVNIPEFLAEGKDDK